MKFLMYLLKVKLFRVHFNSFYMTGSFEPRRVATNHYRSKGGAGVCKNHVFFLAFTTVLKYHISQQCLLLVLTSLLNQRTGSWG